ncbi:NACHT domain-containing protein [Spirulina sp. CCNP1310]|uniref:NACHT domain-containing protein n=1 Tax=Spirulina sp. CCNP1310 TaxID=3110249 RepID=UPI002B209787|nr:NACHT domain-containing protein [Spirulina sp. CCNP1310]MEA5419029.1 NACHT domain-containing protein [Spirulina sp. CCNP1310]
MIEPVSMILLPVLINVVTGPIDAPQLLRKFQRQQRPMNHDLQKAIKVAYLNALIEIAMEYREGKMQSFRLYMKTQIDRQIEQWQGEIAQVQKAKDVADIASPLGTTAEIEALLLSHGESEGVEALASKLITEAFRGIADVPTDYQAQIKTQLFGRIYAHFVEEMKGNDRAYRAFELEYLPMINSGLTGMALTMNDMVGVINRTDENVQKLVDLLKPKSLTLADWRAIAQLMLANRKVLTANPAFKRVDVYVPVPLALVERRQPQQRQPGQAGDEPGSEREVETLTPIAEAEFFNQVLRQGKSPQSQGRRIAVIGEPGSGKTTRLQAIADWIIDEELGIPIWIELAGFTEPTLIDYLEKWLKVAGADGAMTSLQDHKEHLWLLMDGLDEMVARIERPHVSQLLDGWIGAARVIITCRVNVWEADQNAFSGFDVYRNLPFEVDQMEDFIRRFFAKTD